MNYRPNYPTGINSERRPWGGGRTHVIWGGEGAQNVGDKSHVLAPWGQIRRRVAPAEAGYK